MAKIKVSLLSLLIIGPWLLLEIASLVLYDLRNRTAFSYAKALAQLEAAIPTSSLQSSVSGLSELRWVGDFVEVLHPYFGFVADPTQNNPELNVSDFGFLQSEARNALVKRSPSKVIVALFGGSFARLTQASLQAAFDRHSAKSGREFVVINFASDGFKQPQQLMVLNYFLALGAEFDLVINLDGFNEVSLPPSENIPYHVNPFFPRKWDRRTSKALNPAMIRLIGYAEVCKADKETWARIFKDHRLYLSPTLFLFWQAHDNKLAQTIYDTNEKIKTESSQTQSYTMRGPPYLFENDAALYRDLVDVWKRCSLQMKDLSEANGAKYYHFLQPNQYVAGSKPMGDAERWQAINERSRFAEGAVKGYPFLSKAGGEIQSAGVQFTDLTMIFSEHSEQLYIDDCCHTNKEGSDIVANRIYETIYPPQ